MKTYKCRYEFASDNHPETSDRQISAETPQEAYAEYLKQVGVRQIPVVVFWFAGAMRSESFDGHINPGQEESRQSSSKKPATETAVTHSSQTATSSTDTLLKQLIEEQKFANKILNRVLRMVTAVAFYALYWHLTALGYIPW